MPNFFSFHNLANYTPWRDGHGPSFAAAQQFKATCFIVHLMELINFQIRFYEDTCQKKGREQAHVRVQGGNTQTFVLCNAIYGINNNLSQPH